MHKSPPLLKVPVIQKYAALWACVLIALGTSIARSAPSKSETYDVVVYGGVSGGVTAAVQAARMGKAVVLIEPGKHLGGMTSGGLGWVDVGNPETIGGLAREYFQKVWAYYQDDAAWKWEKKHAMPGQHPQLHADDQTMWILEPSVAERLFDQMAADVKVIVVRNERLNRQSGVKMEGKKITSIAMESGRVFIAKMFIDATYEGDLMAAAGVSYFVGREPNSRYNETLNGIHVSRAIVGSERQRVDPYRIPGDPKSGLLPRVQPGLGGIEGEGDKHVQAYNYRMCLTNAPENRLPVEKPADYDEGQYEIVFRAIEAGQDIHKLLKLSPLPNRKTDTNNSGPVSTDFIGMSSDYPEADYATRERIAKMHEQWQRGLVWTLQNHPRVPEEVRKIYAPWGLAKDEFADTGHWPFQLYVREARRMISDCVVTENTALGKEVAPDPVGLGSYMMDSHSSRYFVAPNGFVALDGGMSAKVPEPFGISFRAIIPKRGECENLLVPVCASASHAAYGSMRMEPVFMVLGQSAATAASLAIDRGVALQELPYSVLRERLLADKQIIGWQEKKESPATPKN